MDHSGAAVAAGRRIRRWRSVSEKRQIVQLTMEPGASVAEVAREHGVNANQVFKWRRAFDRGELIEAGVAPATLLPVILSAPSAPGKHLEKPASQEQAVSAGTIHIELPGRAMIRVESGADAALLRSILEILRK